MSSSCGKDSICLKWGFLESKIEYGEKSLKESSDLISGALNGA